MSRLVRICVLLCFMSCEQGINNNNNNCDNIVVADNNTMIPDNATVSDVADNVLDSSAEESSDSVEGNPCQEWTEIVPLVEGNYNCYNDFDSGEVVTTCPFKVWEYKNLCLGWCGDWGFEMFYYVFEPFPPDQAEMFVLTGAYGGFLYCRRAPATN